MPYSHQLTRYPREYVDLLLAASNPALGEKGMRVHLDTPHQAHAFRAHVYAFIRAYERAHISEQQLYPELNKQITGSVYLVVEGTDVVLRGRQFTPTMDAVRAALAATSTAPRGEMPDPDEFARRVVKAPTPYGVEED